MTTVECPYCKYVNHFYANCFYSDDGNECYSLLAETLWCDACEKEFKVEKFLDCKGVKIDE